ncbi:hypothetical protein RN001_014273 [Aquatica leii]|uniref:Secreted protein n=1 Tax=Aquatica leii TaxID=1421715 RepID=A0AAN7P3Y8_9COLE|nr:hypothetical protein RN001_014273 [Aquatica leii]
MIECVFCYFLLIAINPTASILCSTYEKAAKIILVQFQRFSMRNSGKKSNRDMKTLLLNRNSVMAGIKQTNNPRCCSCKRINRHGNEAISNYGPDVRQLNLHSKTAFETMNIYISDFIFM